MSGATCETQFLRRALRHNVANSLSVVYARPLFARKVGSLVVKWRIIETLGKGFRGSHNHMARDGAGEGDGSSHEDRLGGRHVDVAVWMQV